MWNRFAMRIPIALCLAALAGGAAAQKAQLPLEGYTQTKHKKCISCHRSDPVKEIFKTLHADAKNPDTPAANEQCESCHGPGAAHVGFPLQVQVFNFGENSPRSTAEQSGMCLKCHQDGKQSEWKDGMHDQPTISCVTCHSVHKSEDPILNQALAADRCVECHKEMNAQQHVVGLHVIENGKVSCTDCHNPHAKLDTSLCVNCHDQDEATLAKQSAKAQEFHAAMRENNLSCLKCHRGTAHGVPAWVKELAEKQQAQ